MTADERDELACMHALGLLEGEELAVFLRELDSSPSLRRAVGTYRATSVALAHSAPEVEPPAELRERVLLSAARREPLPAPRAAPVIPIARWLPLLAAACLAAALLPAERNAAILRSQNEELRLQRQAAESALADARRELEDTRHLLAEAGERSQALSARLREHDDLAHYKITTLASMLGDTPAALAVAVWDPTREQGVLSVSKLPALNSNKDYQLWVIDPQYPAPVNAGTFVVDPVTGDAHVVFRADKPVKTVAKYAVTLERKGGVPKAEGPVVLLSP
jgi:anti-sigma-K factor RskA